MVDATAPLAAAMMQQSGMPLDPNEQNDTQYKVGDRVTVKAGQEHMPNQARAIGTVKEIASSPALGIVFDGSPGEYKWYVDAELEPFNETPGPMPPPVPSMGG